MLRCPRCIHGSLFNRSYSLTDAAIDHEVICSACGHEVLDIPLDVLDEVKRAKGKIALLNYEYPRMKFKST